jgi:hypothetical protein
MTPLFFIKTIGGGLAEINKTDTTQSRYVTTRGVNRTTGGKFAGGAVREREFYGKL